MCAANKISETANNLKKTLFLKSVLVLSYFKYGLQPTKNMIVNCVFLNLDNPQEKAPLKLSEQPLLKLMFTLKLS